MLGDEVTYRTVMQELSGAVMEGPLHPVNCLLRSCHLSPFFNFFPLQLFNSSTLQLWYGEGTVTCLPVTFFQLLSSSTFQLFNSSTLVWRGARGTKVSGIR
ncbi:MAG: hypothetical protein RB296_07150 [Acidobacteriota bacterium]|jgi:hypothetical protein|nr:hypothetical protein [Acidobacteriota bacterium]